MAEEGRGMAEGGRGMAEGGRMYVDGAFCVKRYCNGRSY